MSCMNPTWAQCSWVCAMPFLYGPYSKEDLRHSLIKWGRHWVLPASIYLFCCSLFKIQIVYLFSLLNPNMISEFLSKSNSNLWVLMDLVRYLDSNWVKRSVLMWWTFYSTSSFQAPWQRSVIFLCESTSPHLCPLYNSLFPFLYLSQLHFTSKGLCRCRTQKC